MAKKKKAGKGEQMALLDVGPEHTREIAAAGRRCKILQRARLKALDAEVKEKQKIRQLVEKENLTRLQDGRIRFKCDGLLIEITPRDELVTVKEEKKKAKDVKGKKQAKGAMAKTVASEEERHDEP